MNEPIDREKEEYNRANIRLADAFHRMSEIYEEWSEKEKFASMGLSDLDLALKWERLTLKSRRRYSDLPGNIKAGENNIQRIKEKIKKYERSRFEDDKSRNN